VWLFSASETRIYSFLKPGEILDGVLIFEVDAYSGTLNPKPLFG